MESLPNHASSIEAVWPPVESNNGRIRGFYNQLVQSSVAAEDFITTFNDYQGSVANSADHSRLSIRLLTRPETLQIFELAGVQVEGAIPLYCEADLVVAYTAWNAPERYVSVEQIKSHGKLLSETVAKKSNHFSRTTLTRNFVPGLINHETKESEKDRKIEQFAELQSVFGCEKSDIEEMLKNPNNIIAYIGYKNQIASIAIAEITSVYVEDYGILRLAEVTGSVTKNEYRGLGLYTVVSELLSRELQKHPEYLNIVYRESNLAMKGILCAASRSGYRFNYFDKDRLGKGRSDFGILKQNIHVNDGEERRQYNDFALSYISRQ